MPVSGRAAASAAAPESHHLRPYTFHGVHLFSQGGHAVGDCPFCGRERKFSLDLGLGLWRCWVCAAGTVAGGGNGLIFTRLIHERAILAAGNAIAVARIAQDRRLLFPDTVVAWGICVDPGGTWLIPGYGPDGKLDQVYRRERMFSGGMRKWTWVLKPTPGIWPEGKMHALHLPAGDFDPVRPNILVCEGPWDGMALWEVWDRSAGDTNIVAVPGCTTWRDEWTAMCRGKHVTLMYDSDHPRPIVAGRVSRAGYDGMARVAKRLNGAAASVRYLKWGPEGYDSTKPSGWDIRDFLCQ